MLINRWLRMFDLVKFIQKNDFGVAFGASFYHKGYNGFFTMGTIPLLRFLFMRLLFGGHMVVPRRDGRCGAYAVKASCIDCLARSLRSKLIVSLETKAYQKP